jgi:hypothetical protein
MKRFPAALNLSLLGCFPLDVCLFPSPIDEVKYPLLFRVVNLLLVTALPALDNIPILVAMPTPHIFAQMRPVATGQRELLNSWIERFEHGEPALRGGSQVGKRKSR